MERTTQQPPVLPPDAAADALADRYGTRRRPVARLASLAVIVIGAGAALGWLAWAAWFHATTPIDADVTGFTITPHVARTTVQLRVSDGDVTGTCILRASASDHSIVGEQSMRVDGDRTGEQGGSKLSTRVVDVRTEREATTVEVARCTPDS